MRPTPRKHSLVVLVPIVGVALWGLGGMDSRGVRAGERDVRVATSVCEAHELRALQEENPQLEIEIPAEFDFPWPTRAACLSHAAAEDPSTPGPVQPIQFSHKHHSGLYKIDCQYCHTATDRSPAAGVPSVELCMGCHAQFPPSYDELEGVRTLKQHWERREPIEWIQIHRLPEHVQFQHQAHVRAGFDCKVCHGDVQKMDKIYLVPDTQWWPWALPTKKLEMGWCVDCHRKNNGTQDCYACHY
ncbi:MAG TPA: cytochrome c3 family protein [Myxococcota bacterium]